MILPSLVGSEGYALMTLVSCRSAVFSTAVYAAANPRSIKSGQIFSYSDAGQMNMYLNYAKEHWTLPDENPPIGLVLCAEKGVGEAHYVLVLCLTPFWR